MKPDGKHWVSCDDEWGRGSGYRNRVSEHHENWFADYGGDVPQLANGRFDFVKKEWQEVLNQLSEILEEN